MRTRIAFVNGIWQLCMVAAAMWQEQDQHPNCHNQDFLLMYSRPAGSFSNQELSEFVVEIAPKCWNWKGMIQLTWEPRDWVTDWRTNPKQSVQSVLDHFNLLDVSQVDEIWLCKLQFLDERLFADIFKTAQIVLYEDGLHTYARTDYLMKLPAVDFKTLLKTFLIYKAFVRNLLQGNFNWVNNGVKRSHLRRVKTFYSVLGDKIAIAPVFRQIPLQLVEQSLLVKFFLELGKQLVPHFDLRLPDAKFALFLGSNLCHIQSFPRELEVQTFVDAIRSAQLQGLTVLWKEHPRCKKPLLPDIENQLPESHIISLSSAQKIPTEVIASRVKLDLCCSTLSSSLFYLNQIYGLETQTCVRPLLKCLQGDFYELSELTLATIPECF